MGCGVCVYIVYVCVCVRMALQSRNNNSLQSRINPENEELTSSPSCSSSALEKTKTRVCVLHPYI